MMDPPELSFDVIVEEAASTNDSAVDRIENS